MARFRPRPNLATKWDVQPGRWFSISRAVTPPQLFIASFAALILFGTLGLKLLPGLYTGEPLSWLDALFTATSAVCVTGLIVVDTATHFTFAGQAFLLLLIQLGGLGMLAFTSLIILALGRRLSLRQEALSTGTRDIVPQIEPRRLALDVIRFTFAAEAIGAVCLYVLWVPRFGFLGAIWPAIFQSVSAFCSAGFSTFSNSLVDFQRSPLTLLVMIGLIVSGGLGFLTIEELYLRYQAGKRKQIFRISLHSRMVVVTTALLLAAGWLLYGAFEWNATLGELPIFHRITNSLFMSTTARTAGFNTVDYSRATDSGNFLTIILMMIGGSPGSTAGGIKTTTFAVIGLLAWSRLMGLRITTFGNRSVREETADRAIGLFVIAFGIVTAGVFILTATEAFTYADRSFLTRMFEAVSAFCTVGLSMGITPQLSTMGRVTAILLMFLGRVGPLTITAAIALRTSGDRKFRYAYEDVVVG
jgi:trk system potassium uptake protein